MFTTTSDEGSFLLTADGRSWQKESKPKRIKTEPGCCLHQTWTLFGEAKQNWISKILASLVTKKSNYPENSETGRMI